MVEPVLEDRGGRGSGRVVLPKVAVGQLDDQSGPAFDPRPLLEAKKTLFGFSVEIADRQGRIGVALAGEKARDVAQIFPLQRERVIFGMPLEKYELAAKLFGED